MKNHLLLVISIIVFFSTPKISWGQLFGPSFSACVLNTPTKRLENVRKIAILDFEDKSNFILRKLGADFGDRLPGYMTADLIEDYRGAVEKRIYMHKVPTNVFSIIERNQIDVILKEQGLSVSGAIDESQAADIGKLLGVDAMILGNLSYSFEDETYTRTSEKKDGTKETTYYRKRELNASAGMKIVSVQTGEIVGTANFTNSQSDTESSKKGYPSKGAVDSGEFLAEKAFKSISKRLVNYFAPYYQTRSFSLRKVKFKKFRDDAKDANKFLKDGEMERGFVIYKKIYDADPYNPIAAYNLGTIHEAVGNFMDAKKYYELAYQLEGDSKVYKRAVEKAKEYAEMIADLEAIGINIEKYAFDVSAESMADKVEVKGSSGSRVAIYSSPSKSSEIVVRVPGGVDLSIIEKMKGWYKVRLITGDEGYLPERDGKVK